MDEYTGAYHGSSSSLFCGALRLTGFRKLTSRLWTKFSRTNFRGSGKIPYQKIIRKLRMSSYVKGIFPLDLTGLYTRQIEDWGLNRSPHHLVVQCKVIFYEGTNTNKPQILTLLIWSQERIRHQTETPLTFTTSLGFGRSTKIVFRIQTQEVILVTARYDGLLLLE